MSEPHPLAKLRPGDPVLASAADDAYTMPLAVSVRSAIEHLDPARRLGVVILDGGITPANRLRLERSWPRERVEISWVRPDPALFEGIPTWRWLSRVAYYRLLLPLLLPETLERVIYLDVDLVVQRDLGALWEEPFRGALALAAQDPSSPFFDSRRAMPPGWEEPASGFTAQPVRDLDARGLAPTLPYLNSGLLVLDLPAWRHERITEQLLTCLRNAPEDHLIGGDQYPLNVVLAERWRALDPRWNALAVMHERSSWRETHMDAATFEEVLRDPWIVHWAGPRKPWNGLGEVPRGDLFHTYRARTAWSGLRGRARMASLRWARSRKRARRRVRGLRKRARPLARVPFRARSAAAEVRLRTLRLALGRRKAARSGFLMGCGESGTQMLISRLGRTWQVEVVSEGDPAAFRNGWLTDLETVGRVAAERRGRCVLFEPILDTPRIPEILARFREARVLFALRHFEPVIRSGLQRFGPEGWPGRVAGWAASDFSGFQAPVPEATCRRVRGLWRPDLDRESMAALYWLFYSGLHEDMDLAKDPRVRLVHYEAVLDDPVEQLRGLCRFLGVGYRSAMAEGVRASKAAPEPLAIDPEIRSACEALYERLCETARVDALRTAP